jgi:hypothetical protein
MLRTFSAVFGPCNIVVLRLSYYNLSTHSLIPSILERAEVMTFCGAAVNQQRIGVSAVEQSTV